MANKDKPFKAHKLTKEELKLKPASVGYIGDLNISKIIKSKEAPSIPNEYFQFLGDSYLYEIPSGSSLAKWFKSATEEEIKENINIEEIKKAQEKKRIENEKFQSGESKVDEMVDGSNQMLDLNKLERKLDEALSKETEESLRNWLKGRRMT